MGLVDLRSQATRRTPEALLEHMKTFELDLKFSAGVWFFAKGGIRFHEAYGPPLTIAERLEIAAGLADYGLAGMEAHYPNEINEENLDLWKQFTRDTGIRVVTIVPNLFYEGQWEWGSLSNPDPEVRQTAIDRVKRTLELNKEMDTDFAVVWPGGDGYEIGFGVDMMAARDRFAQGLAEAMDAVPGVRVAEEPKPYEPRGHILYGTTPEGILLGMKVEGLLKNPENRNLLDEGHAMCCLNPEVGHMLMAFEDMPYAFSLVLEYGRLAHTHWNAQPLGNYDQDLNVGMISPEAAEAALYAMKMHGYRGYFGIDINPERMPVDDALKVCMDALRAANDRINEMDHEAIMYATNHPWEAQGWLEGYLVRARAPHPDRLPPLSPVK
ncbi:MAG: TIM barrel protein [Anaerolineae bacterium]|jgi:xylose isomerase